MNGDSEQCADTIVENLVTAISEALALGSVNCSMKI